MTATLMASGGIDSTVLMYLAREQISHVVLMDYGQASADHQWWCVEHHAQKNGLTAHRHKILWPEYARGKGYIFEAGKYPEKMDDPYEPVRMSPEQYQEYLENKWDFIQGRNIVFLAYAGAYALAHGCDTVMTAFQFDEPEWAAGAENIYSDTSPTFLEAFNYLSKAGGFSKSISFRAPFLDTYTQTGQRWFKRHIVNIGRAMGVDLSRTHSCEFFPACGGCHQCIIRKGLLLGRHR